MTERYKIWVNIEKITGEGADEKYEDASPFPWSLGEFATYAEAAAKIDELIYPRSLSVVDRVWDGESGVNPAEALRRGIKVDCWFVRKDGWTLGSPKEHISTAAELWQDEWVEVHVMGGEAPAIRLTYDEWRAIHDKRQ